MLDGIPPVLVVGTGPVGLFQAYALSKLGVQVILIGKYATRLGAPKAHALSPRSLEICRQFGISVNEIRSHPAPREEARWVRFVTNLSGEEIGCLPYERMSLDVLEATPEMLHNIAQPDFEAMMLSLVEQEQNITVKRGWSWLSSTEDSKGVSSTIKNTYTGDTETIASSVVIGCDGANSTVRKSTGITLEAEDGVESMMTIHFSANLRTVVRERVGMLHWIFDPAARGFIIAYDLGGNQVLIHNFDPKLNPVDTFTPERCRQIVRCAIGQDVPTKVHSSLPWLLRRQVAHEFFKGRVILAGDAAHSFPPTGGLGLNSGIADAHNLAYKIALVYNSGANLRTLLQQYHDERRPIALRNSLQSVINGRKVFSMLKSLNCNDPDTNNARASMMQVLGDADQRAKLTGLIRDQVEHFDNLMLHIGYVYEPGWSPANATDFVPAYRRGARLPHAWINMAEPRASHMSPVDLSYLRGDLAEADIQSWQYSTLDLVPHNKFSLLLEQSSPWVKEIAALTGTAEKLGVPIQVSVYGKDFWILDPAVEAAWLSGFGMNSGGAVFVRPDQHVLKLCESSEEDWKSILHDLLLDNGLH